MMKLPPMIDRDADSLLSPLCSSATASSSDGIYRGASTSIDVPFAKDYPYSSMICSIFRITLILSGTSFWLTSRGFLYMSLKLNPSSPESTNSQSSPSFSGSESPPAADSRTMIG